jgi:hypothetical protein
VTIPRLVLWFLQEENMVSSKEISQKYSSFAQYEDDFM